MSPDAGFSRYEKGYANPFVQLAIVGVTLLITLLVVADAVARDLTAGRRGIFSA